MIAVGAVLIGAYIALYYSSLFTITDVRVSGNNVLQSSYVLNMAEVDPNSTFLRTDTESIKARLLTETWIQNVEVERVFPSTLVLHITERPVAARVSIVPETANDSSSVWIIADDGVWISEIEVENEGGVILEAEQFVKIPRIKDVSAAVRPVSGELETDEGIRNALALLHGFSPEMRAMVSTISAPDAVKTQLTLYNNVGVAFGAAVDIEAKEKAIATLLAEHEGTITFINVRVPERATFRATDSP